MMKTNEPQKVYGVVHPDTKDVQFAFHATDATEAARKVAAWDRYHGFTGHGASACKEPDPQSQEATWLHNEWMS